jgi:hypothetical protein
MDSPYFPPASHSDQEAAANPLVEKKYRTNLHLAIGNLRQFDATQNSSVAWGA